MPTLQFLAITLWLIHCFPFLRAICSTIQAFLWAGLLYQVTLQNSHRQEKKNVLPSFISEFWTQLFTVENKLSLKVTKTKAVTPSAPSQVFPGDRGRAPQGRGQGRDSTVEPFCLLHFQRRIWRLPAPSLYQPERLETAFPSLLLLRLWSETEYTNTQTTPAPTVNRKYR